MRQGRKSSRSVGRRGVSQRHPGVREGGENPQKHRRRGGEEILVVVLNVGAHGTDKGTCRHSDGEEKTPERTKEIPITVLH
jgi:hypothetical protein